MKFGPKLGEAYILVRNTGSASVYLLETSVVFYISKNPADPATIGVCYYKTNDST